MDRLAAMTVFVAVAEAGSLSAAGRKLKMPLATVSRKLAELESHLNAQLLQRSTRVVTLSEAGQAYLAASRQILERVQEAERSASGEYRTPTGELVVTAPIVCGRLHLLPIVCEFMQAYPDVQVRLVLSDRHVNLLEEHIDVALRIGSLPDSRLVATRVGATRKLVCASPGYLRGRARPKHPEQLRDHPCIVFSGLEFAGYWNFVERGNKLEVPIQPRLSVTTAEAACDAAIAGVGITRLMAYQVDQAVRDGRLQILLPRYEPPASPVSLVYAPQALMPLKQRAFLDFATPRLRQRLQAP